MPHIHSWNAFVTVTKQHSIIFGTVLFQKEKCPKKIFWLAYMASVIFIKFLIPELFLMRKYQKIGYFRETMIFTLQNLRMDSAIWVSYEEFMIIFLGATVVKELFVVWPPLVTSYCVWKYCKNWFWNVQIQIQTHERSIIKICYV